MRYVDNSFVITSCKEEKKLLTQELNEAHEAIKFTNECKVNNLLVFLDVIVVKQNSQFKIRVYKKPTFKISYLNFQQTEKNWPD